MPRTIDVGDVHGCLLEAQELIQKVEYRPGKDRLVFLGDLIDRGPLSVECVRWVRSLHAEVVRSNHEQKVVEFREKETRALAGGPANGMERPYPKRMAEWMAFTLEELAWMNSRPLWLDLGGGWVAVHAGFEPKPLAEQKADRVTRVRWVDEKTGEFVGMKRIPVLDDPELIVKPRNTSDPERAASPEAIAKREKRQAERLAKGMAPVVEQRRRPKKYITTFDQPNGSRSWRAAWPGPQSVIYGHDAQKGTVRVESQVHDSCSSQSREVFTVGIDTGVVFGFKLTAAVFNEGVFPEFVQVQAKEVYYKWPEAPGGSE